MFSRYYDYTRFLNIGSSSFSILKKSATKKSEEGKLSTSCSNVIPYFNIYGDCSITCFFVTINNREIKGTSHCCR